MELLIKLGADVRTNDSDEYEYTPSHKSADEGNSRTNFFIIFFCQILHTNRTLLPIKHGSAHYIESVCLDFCLKISLRCFFILCWN